jgi:glutamate--cysteine ligase
MHRTASIQLNLDFADEADMVEKLRIALALQPVAVALAANAPFCDGTPSGAVSERGLVWLDVDEERCGVPRFVFEDGMGFERWVDYALSVPMYSVVRDGRHVDLAGRSFRDFMAGELEALPGERPTLADWRSHLNTLMPEVRLKQHLELRGADSGSPATAAALCAFWTGLLYDPAARAEAAALVGGWTEAQRCRLRRSAPVLGLCAPFGRRTLGDLAAEAVAIAARGLAALAAQGADDRRFLEPFVAASADGRAPADHLLTAFRGPWLEDLAPLYEACDLAAP